MHLLNAALAAVVAVLCIYQSNWRKANRVRNSRIIGLGILNFGIVWFSYSERIEPLQGWVPLVTVGLIFCIHGLYNDAQHEGAIQLAANREETR